MDYKLVLQLKEAGFPQTGVSKKFAYLMNDWNDHGSESAGAYIPTLSELLQACGKKFESLVQTPTGCWVASYMPDEKYLDAKNNGDIVVFGPSAEEAIAKLWLEINNKQ